MTRTPIRYSAGKGLLLRLLGLPARRSYIDIGDTDVRVRMGWAFRASFNRSRVESAIRGPRVRLTTGAHGARGRWLVNGASGPIVTVRLNGPVRAWLIVYPIRLRELSVSVADPEALIAALS